MNVIQVPLVRLLNAYTIMLNGRAALYVIQTFILRVAIIKAFYFYTPFTDAENLYTVTKNTFSHQIALH